MKLASILLGAGAVVAVVVLSSVYIVDEREQVLVLQFGEVVDKRSEPGMSFKLPFIQNVVRFEDRILSIETDPLEVTPLDDRRLVVDAFARWRIADTVKFRRAVGDERQASDRLERILNAALRQELGAVSSDILLSAERVKLGTKIRDVARASASDLGVEVIDVRIKRADLPEQNLAATFSRMQAERQRIAADERARGQEAATILRAQADRTVVETVSEARKKAEIVRGEADATRNGIFAEAFGRDPEFFAFYRSLSAYEKAMTPGNSSVILSPDSEFFDYLQSDRGRAVPVPAVPAAPLP